MSAASRFFFERKLVYPFAFVSFSVDFCLCIVLFLKYGFYFSLRNKVGFPLSHPFPSFAGAHTVRPCSPRMPVPFPQSRLSFKKNSARCASSAWHKTPLLNRLIFIKNVFLSYCPLLQTNFLSPQNRLSFSSFLWNYVGYPMNKSRVSRETKSVPAWK